MDKRLQSFQRLLDIMDDLRAGCPWDRKQTFESLRNLTIEETYELADAILKSNPEEIKEEIGDLMLHMVFYAKIASEKDWWDIADALEAVCDKLVARHPHIYGDAIAEDEETVKRNWEKLKLKEGKKSVLAGVPDSMPAMIKAYRMQDKTAKVGFDWDNPGDAWKKVEEEINEFKDAVDEQLPFAEQELEYGDILFSLINYGRLSGLDPETALERVNQKFKKRFEYIEKHATKELEEMTLEEMDALWDESKKTE